MNDLLLKTCEFLKDAGKGNAKLDEIINSMAKEPWRVCIVGGFSRGKTRLLNHLLDTELFPEDVVPATTVLTEVNYARTLQMEFVGLSETVAWEPTSDNLEKFCAGNEYSDAQGVIRVGYPASFLYPDLKLYDTPGIDDIMEHRADITFAALEKCDAALVVTSALAPLGLTEIQFIESYLFARRIPRIAIVATFLDQLSEEDAIAAMENIKAKARGISPALEVWCLQSASCDASGAAAMRDRLHQWADDPDRAKWRQKRALAMASILLRDFITEDTALLRSLSGDVMKEEEKISIALRDLSESAESWNELRSGFMDGGVACIEKLKNLAARMADELQSKEVNSDCENRPREMMRKFSMEIAETAQKCFDQDLTTLLDGIRKTYGIEPAMPRDIKITPAETNIMSSGEGLNWYIAQAFDFVEEHLDDLVQFVPLPPVGRTLAREMARKLVVLGKEFCGVPENDAQAATRFVNEAARDITSAIREVYAQTGERARAIQLSWMEAQKSRLLLAGGIDKRKNQIELLNKNIGTATKLLSQIRELLGEK